MKVSEIPANKLTIMTPELYQEFCQAGCVPACHASDKWINIGDKFLLKTGEIAVHPSGGTAGMRRLETRDVILSEFVSVKDFMDLQRLIVENWKKGHAEAVKQGRGGCYRVNGKIVI